MGEPIFQWGLIGLMAMIAANQPFFRRPLRGWQILLEWMIGYALCLIVAYYLESQRYDVHVQPIVFYVITILLFLSLSFPGIIYRKLWKG